MTKPKRSRDLKRARNGEAAPSPAPDGTWRITITIGKKADGTSLRKTLRGRTKEEVFTKVAEVRRTAEIFGPERAAAKIDTVDQWFDAWLESTSHTVKESTWSFYESIVRNHLRPAFGKLKLNQMTPERIEKVLHNLTSEKKTKRGVQIVPVSASVKKGCHRTLRACLGVAHARGHVTVNAASLVKVAPAVEEEIEPFTMQEAARLFDAARRTHEPGRWMVALLLGLRQGETLGLRWSDLDLDTGELRLTQQLPRRYWRHGCGKKAEDCGKAMRCPYRRRTEQFTTPKSSAGRRRMQVPPTLLSVLKEQRRNQLKLKLATGPGWQEFDLVFTTTIGTPHDHRNDSRAWHTLLKDAKLPEAKLHAARHVAATSYLLAGVDKRALMSLMGWSESSMADRYTHVVQSMRESAANAIENLFFGKR